ncbi:putative nuclease HARBI1 [Aphidius gifuensis]|uniref:putative nuclease HARBI1 n=1 Tax=Aphidius gifuensis TaxID=684658 RepID=UPI001CDC9EEB|nr:putative nuclease HARBI1 [Aphidius gifuensis]
MLIKLSTIKMWIFYTYNNKCILTSNCSYLVNNEPNERAITHEKAFLLTVYYLANTETFREISDRFDLTMSSAHCVLQNTLDFIISLQDEYLVWPHNREDKRDISQRFSEIQNINGVIGAIDGCHIRIKRLMEQQRDYFNRKQFHSIVIQAVATSNYVSNIITDVHIGEPGSMHDSRVLRRSPLYAAAHDNPDFFDGYFLLGDSAYANLPWLVPPFRDNGHLTDEEREFNYKHSSTRVRIEHTFGLLKCRFRRLNKFNNLLLDIVIRCTMASCILHNILTIARINNINIDDDSDDDNNNDNDDYNDNERVFVEDRRQYIFQNMFVDRVVIMCLRKVG